MAHRLFSIDLLEVFSIALTAIRMNKLRSVLTLLGIEHGLVALTKSDRVRPEQLELVTAQYGIFFPALFSIQYRP